MCDFLRDSAGLGKALVYTLSDVDRTDHPGGREGGGPGKKCDAFLTCAPESRSQCKFEQVVKAGSKFVLYATEAETLVFLEIEDKAALWAEPFLDRGARKLVKVGAKVAVASFATAKAWIEENEKYNVLLEGKVCFVFNTGRCGSTLLHRALEALDVQSSSEPHWCDQLGARAPEAERDHTWQATVLCLALEFHLCPKNDAKRFALNPKNISGGAWMADFVATDFPKAKMCFVYRSLEKVAASFGKLLHAGEAEEDVAEQRAAWKKVPPLQRFETLPVLPLFDEKLGEECKEGNLALGEASRAAVAAEFAKWFEAVASWLRLVQERHASNCDDPLTNAVCIRYDEFVDPKTRADVLVAALRHLGGFFETDGDLAKALAVFDVDSQAGSAMVSAKGGADFLTDADRVLARRCVVDAAKVLKLPLAADDKGANCKLPNTLSVDDCPSFSIPEMGAIKKVKVKVDKFEQENCAIA